MKKIEITKCLFPITKNWTGVPMPKIDGMACITASIVKIGDKEYEQFEYIPEDLNLCSNGNARREGDFIHIVGPNELGISVDVL